MKRIIKIWDAILLGILGLFTFSCTASKPPAAEYGPPPQYNDEPDNGIYNTQPDTTFNPDDIYPEYGVPYRPYKFLLKEKENTD